MDIGRYSKEFSCSVQISWSENSNVFIRYIKMFEIVSNFIAKKLKSYEVSSNLHFSLILKAFLTLSSAECPVHFLQQILKSDVPTLYELLFIKILTTQDVPSNFQLCLNVYRSSFQGEPPPSFHQFSQNHNYQAVLFPM